MPDVTRLTPLKGTLRELYLKSGNQCAFPGCTEIMIDKEGDFVGQVCHIEAAEEGGERFNPKMTNEDRRAFSNLVLMCYSHHVKTNNVDEYTVPILQKMKADHEAKFTDIAETIERSIQDRSAPKTLTESVSLERINRILGWGHGAEELKGTLSEVAWASGQLRMLPQRTRQLLTVVVSRLGRIALPAATGQKYRYEERIMADEIADACDLEQAEVQRHVEIMEKYEIGRYEMDGWGGTPPTIHLRDTPVGWFIWGDIREFCSLTETQLSSIIEQLRFDLLD